MDKLYIASDHAGYQVKSLFLLKFPNIQDLGPENSSPTDYPLYANKMCALLEENKGILICSTGVGMSIAANRFSHVRAGLIHSLEDLILARQHNNINILCLGAKNFSLNIEDVVKCFLETPFEGGRHERRLQLLK
jgi:ribose 5-phosphate isomerase B